MHQCCVFWQFSGAAHGRKLVEASFWAVFCNLNERILWGFNNVILQNMTSETRKCNCVLQYLQQDRFTPFMNNTWGRSDFTSRPLGHDRKLNTYYMLCAQTIDNSMAQTHVVIFMKSSEVIFFGNFYAYPSASKASREVANLTERKILHTPVYGVKEFVCLW